MDKISIIVPVYNTDKYLSRCLDSLINQTYSNIEIICVDDKSTDNSRRILEEYGKKDSRGFRRSRPFSVYSYAEMLMLAGITSGYPLSRRSRAQ